MDSPLKVYLVGVGVSLGFTVARYAHAFHARTFTAFHSNLQKIGLRQSYLTGEWIQIGSTRQEFPYAMAASAVLVLGSWFGIVVPLIETVQAWWRRWTLPPRLKELSWRMSHVNLDAEELERLDYEILELTHGVEEAARIRARLEAEFEEEEAELEEEEATREKDGRDPS